MKFEQLLVFLFFNIYPYIVPAQDTISTHYFQKDSFIIKISFLDSIYGNYKIIPEDLNLEIISALSFYPELKDTHIKFKHKRFQVRATMKAGPRSYFIFQKRQNRSYIIHINNNKGLRKGLDINQLSFNALTGLLGHELGHIYDYSDQSAVSVIWFGIKYTISKKYIKKTEYATDMIAIEHGLGYAIYEFKDYLLSGSKATEKYRKKIKKYYMQPDEILMNIKHQ
ncbi:MAG: hypothetical protein HY738_08635 [Bacteroidia bacterium]|nr:hypothetical protein [Bacteroidia bacterium]